MLMPMLMTLALTLMLLLDALKAAVANNVDADAKMQNDDFHLAGALMCC